MKSYEWYHRIRETIPDFDPGRLWWLIEIQIVSTSGEACVRLVFDYAGQANIVLLARDVLELPLIAPAAERGVLPYTPYDLGELLIREYPDRVELVDELKGWRMTAKTLELIGLSIRESPTG